jgi:small subunit ribosomal protein S6
MRAYPLLRSPAVQGLYDLMLMLDPAAPEERRDEILAGVREAIEADGALLGAHDWGTRRMSFEIDHRPETSYQLIQFEGGPDLLARLDRTLKIADGVMRFRIIGLKPGSPPPPTPRPEPARTREPTAESQRAPRAAADAPR